MDKNTFGKNKADICLVQELERSNDKAQTRAVGKLLVKLSEYLKESEPIKNKKQGLKQYLFARLKEDFMNRINEDNHITDAKVKSFTRNSINAKINDARRLSLSRM